MPKFMKEFSNIVLINRWRFGRSSTRKSNHRWEFLKCRDLPICHAASDEVFHVTGKIYPASETALTLHAVFQDGHEVAGRVVLPSMMA